MQIVRGFFGDLATDAWERIAKIEGTLELRRQQLASAIENKYRQDRCLSTYSNHWRMLSVVSAWEAEQLEGTGLWIASGGILALLIVKLAHLWLPTLYWKNAFQTGYQIHQLFPA